jgi:hypothetical protein
MCRAAGTRTIPVRNKRTEGTDMTLAYRNLHTPDQKRSFQHGDMHVVTLAGTTVVRAIYRPG